MTITRSWLLGSILWLVLMLPPAYAGDVENVSYVERGVQRIFSAAFQLPIYLVKKTFNGPPLLGTLDGALSGTFYTVSSLIGGTFDVVRGTIPYAKYLVFFL